MGKDMWINYPRGNGSNSDQEQHGSGGSMSRWWSTRQPSASAAVWRCGIAFITEVFGAERRPDDEQAIATNNDSQRTTAARRQDGQHGGQVTGCER